MRNLLTLSLILFSFLAFAQTEETQEGKNQEKINQLNQRLDKLLEESKGDKEGSIDLKLDRLFTEIRELKKEVEALNRSFEKLQSGEGGELSKKPMEQDEYYVVIASRRDRERAGRALEAYSAAKKAALKMVQNQRGSWYHIILDQPFSLAEASKRSTAYRKSGIHDCWWVTGKKLKAVQN